MTRVSGNKVLTLRLSIEHIALTRERHETSSEFQFRSYDDVLKRLTSRIPRSNETVSAFLSRATGLSGVITPDNFLVFHPNVPNKIFRLDNDQIVQLAQTSMFMGYYNAVYSPKLTNIKEIRISIDFAVISIASVSYRFRIVRFVPK